MQNPALQQRLFADLQRFAVPRHAGWDPLGLMTVRQALRERLGALGAVEEHRFRSGAEQGVNLILRLPGREPQLEPLLVGAHYDGPLHSPGADDNASGVVALLELAQRWSQRPPRRPVWIVAFDQEEWGMVGSGHLAAELKQAGQPLWLMVSLEMLAYTSGEQDYPEPAMREMYGDRGDFIALVANSGAKPIVSAMAQALEPHIPTRALAVEAGGHDIRGVRLSDHSTFWDAGYDALMVTDTSFMRNPHYHRMSDTVETLDLPFFCGVVEGLEAALSTL